MTALDPNRPRPECPMGSQPCGNPACAEFCNMVDRDPSPEPLRIREWCRGSPVSIVVTFQRDITNEEIAAFPKALLDALESLSGSGE